MSDLDNLRPEAREAMEVIAGEAVCTCHVAYTSRGMKDPGCNHDLAEYVDTVRAELLRLTRDNDEWQTRCLQFQTERDKARAELAALKARIAEASIASLRVSGWVTTLVSDDRRMLALDGQRVALVKVEE